MPAHTPADLPTRTQGFHLMAAVAKEDTHLVRALFSMLPPPLHAQLANFADYDARTPLHLACANGHARIVQILLAHGADPSAKDRFGASCVADAVRHGRIETLRVLAGTAAAAFPSYLQPLHVDPGYALGRDLLTVAAKGDVHAAKQLVRTFAANVNFANADGRTALHLAVARGNVDMARYLIDSGADMHRVDRWAQSPLAEARRSAHPALRDLLVRSDAQRKADELAHIVQEPAAFAVC